MCVWFCHRAAVPRPTRANHCLCPWQFAPVRRILNKFIMFCKRDVGLAKTRSSAPCRQHQDIMREQVRSCGVCSNGSGAA